jgi:two-component system OmpR family response regulator
VILIEDDVELSNGIAAYLRAQGDEVDMVNDGALAAERVRDHAYDMALVDVGLPGLSGYEVVRGIRTGQQAMAVILITARDALSDRIYGLDLGADDYLAKPFELAELTARMRAVMRRGRSTPQPSIVFGPLQLDVDDHQAMLAGQPMSLTGREWALLQALVTAGGRTVPKERLMADSSNNAVEVYVSRLRPRLEPAGLVIRSIRGFGYRLEHRGDAGE